MADKQELWIAKNNRRNARIEIHCGKPSLDKDNTMNHETFVAWVDDFSFPLPEGHCAPLTIGEAVDCRPKPVDELWVESNHSGSIRAYYGSDAGWIQGTFIPVSSLPGFQPNHRCRIAWDESGIRLIGTPERV